MYQNKDIVHFNGYYQRAQKKNQVQNKQSQSRNFAKSLGKHEITFKLQYAAQWGPYRNSFQLVITLRVTDCLSRKEFQNLIKT